MKTLKFYTALLAGIIVVGCYAANTENVDPLKNAEFGTYAYFRFCSSGPGCFEDLTIVTVLPQRYCIMTLENKEKITEGKWRKENGNFVLDNGIVLSRDGQYHFMNGKGLRFYPLDKIGNGEANLCKEIERK